MSSRHDVLADRTATSTAITGCARYADVFQHPLVEDPPAASASSQDRRTYAKLIRQAEQICGECPLAKQCLYSAVVTYDVSGYCAGTTRQQRMAIRHQLGISVEPEDFDTLAGVQARHRQVDHDEVVRLRNANPHESLETIAHRLGCSLSTVKRHLRRARTEDNVTRIDAHRGPTLTQVLRATADVVGRRSHAA